jgi:vacuolar-type H+-ATPase subunit I/STV1
MSESRTLFSSSHYVIDVEIEGEKITLRRIYWPLVYAGNYQKDEVILMPNSISVHERWNGWARYGQMVGGCKSADVEISEEQYNTFKQLMLNVKSVDDFDKLIEYIRKVEEEMEEKVNRKVDELIDEIQSLDFIKQKLEMLEDEELKKEFIERLRTDVEEYFDPGDC